MGIRKLYSFKGNNVIISQDHSGLHRPRAPISSTTTTLLVTSPCLGMYSLLTSPICSIETASGLNLHSINIMYPTFSQAFLIRSLFIVSVTVFAAITHFSQNFFRTVRHHLLCWGSPPPQPGHLQSLEIHPHSEIHPQEILLILKATPVTSTICLKYILYI